MDFNELAKDCLFRYRAYNENTVRELVTGNVWHSKVEHLNDPFEFPLEFDWDYFTEQNIPYIARVFDYPSTERLMELYLMGAHTPLLDSYIQAIKEATEGIFGDFENSFVCCFSKNYDSSLMWSHYADGMKGICIGYSESGLKEQSKFSGISPVRYVSTPVKITLHDLRLEPVSRAALPTIDVSRFPHRQMTRINVAEVPKTYQKEVVWEYEAEFRNVLMPEEHEKKLPGITENVGKDSINLIIFGSKIDPTNLRILELICKERSIPMYKATPVKKDFSVLIEEHNY